MPFIEFMLYSIPVTIVSLSVLAWSYLRGWLRPGTHFFMSWQGIVLAVARWPIVLIAIANAIISLVFRQGRFNYLVTPKGNRALTTRGALKTVAPFLVLSAQSQLQLPSCTHDLHEILMETRQVMSCSH